MAIEHQVSLLVTEIKEHLQSVFQQHPHWHVAVNRSNNEFILVERGIGDDITQFDFRLTATQISLHIASRFRASIELPPTALHREELYQAIQDLMLAAQYPPPSWVLSDLASQGISPLGAQDIAMRRVGLLS